MGATAIVRNTGMLHLAEFFCLPANCLEQWQHLLLKVDKLQGFRGNAPLGHHNKIVPRGNGPLMQAKAFPYKPFNSVTAHCCTNFLGNCHPKPPGRAGFFAPFDEYNKLIGESFFAVVVAPHKIRPHKKPVRGGEC